MKKAFKDLCIVLRSSLIENQPTLKTMYETRCPHCQKLVIEHENGRYGSVAQWDHLHSIYKLSCKNEMTIFGISFYRTSYPQGTGLFPMRYWKIK